MLRTDGPPWWQVFAVNRHLMYLELERSESVNDQPDKPSGAFHRDPAKIAWRNRQHEILRGRAHG